MTDLITALGLVLVVEGLLFAAFPKATRRSLLLASRAPIDQLRYTGIVSAIIGVGIVYLIKVWLV